VSRSKVFSANDGGVELAVVPGRSAHSEQGLVSGVMRCLFCGQFPLLCVVHALVVFSSFLSHPEDRSLLHWLYFCIPASPSSPPSRSSSTCARRRSFGGFLIDTGVFTPAGRAKAPLIGLRLVSATFYRRLQLTADFFVATSVSRADAAPHLVVARVRGFEFVPFWSLG